jgi:RecA/RadA recombinase
MNANEIKIAQDNGKTICIVDVSRTFDLLATRAAGADVEKLLISQPDNAKQAREITESVARSGVAEIIVIHGTITGWAHAAILEAAKRFGTEIRFVA